MNDDPEARKRWVVGVDGSPTSHHALRWALAQSTHRPVTVTAIQCWKPLEGSPDDPRPDEELRAVEQHLDDLRSELGPAASDLRTVAAYGYPVSVLLGHAKTAALLILGNRGQGGFQRLMLGSVSLRTATHSPTPVAIVPPSARLDGALDRIVVGVDGSPNAQAALAWALTFATEGTTVEAVGVWEPSSPATRADPAHFDELSANQRKAFNRSVDEGTARPPSLAASVTRVFDYAKPADTLLRRGAAADLLVVGARGRGAVAAAILGSVTNTVLHQSTCPIVVVPRP